MAQTRVIGMNVVQANLNKQIKKIVNYSEAGLLLAAMHLRRESVKEAPIMTGNLRRSVFVVSSTGAVRSNPKFKDAPKMMSNHRRVVGRAKGEVKRAREPQAQIGYSAVYALTVHENPRAGKTGGVSPSGKAYSAGRTTGGRKSTRVVWAEKGNWKFLENPFKRNIKQMLKIISNKAKKAF